MNSSAKLSRKPDIVTADMDGETVMMCVETGKYYNLGTVGGDIWALLTREMTFAQLIDALTEQYDVARATCEKETAAFVTRMADQGLIRIDA